MADLDAGKGYPTGFAGTMRTDTWWLGPMLTVLGLTAWGVYYAWAALQGAYYAWGPYLSPFYAPLLFVDTAQPGAAVLGHAFFGEWPAWWPRALPPSPALLIFIFPFTFRATCYYYRKAYYRAFFGLPPGCAVNPTPLRPYRGEAGLLLFQNLHRYTLYFALVLLPFLFYEGFAAFFFEGRFGVGIGSVLLLGNAVLLTAYTLGCHSWRHLIGGKLDCFSCNGVSEARHGIWQRVSWLNARHMQFAWISLFWILGADVYVRLLSMGLISDLNTWGI